MESERRRRVSHAMRRTIRRGGGGPDHGRLDWLGSERLAAWTNQTLASEEAYAPFGECSADVWAGAGAGEQMFTGKGQRLAAGIYDFPFRHYCPAQEFPREIPPAWPRWLSPDPSGLAAVNPANPQSWNAYAYVGDTPLEATDPLGLGTITFSTTVSECITCVGVWQPSPWNLLSPTYWDFMDASMQPPTFQTPSGQTGSSAGKGSGAGTGPFHAETAAEAATKYCRDGGEISFDIPFTHVPVTVSLSATAGPVNYSSTNDIHTVVPAIPWPEWLNLGTSVDLAFNAPARPTANPSVGFGRNLSVGYFTSGSGPQGISLSLGASVGPPLNVSVPSGNACAMVVGPQ